MKKILWLLLALLFASPAFAQFADQRQYAPTTGGTANAQTVAIANYGLNIGVALKFVPASTNTASMTLSVNGGAAIVVKRPSVSGLVALSGGEVVSGQVSEVLYDGAQFELLSYFGQVSPTIIGISVVGDPAGPVWINPYLLGSENDTPLIVSATATAHWGAFVAATKTSLTTTPNDSLIGEACLNAADNTTQSILSWCRYAETVIASGSNYRAAFGEENSVENLKANSGTEDPFTITPAHSGINLRLDNGIGATSFDLTAALDIVNNGGKYIAGIIFDQLSLDTTSGYAPAIEMGVNQGISWYSGAGTAAVREYLNNNSAVANAVQVIYGANTVDWYLGAGTYHPLSLTATAATFAVPLTFGAINWPSNTSGANTQTFTNSPCTTSTSSELWVAITITGQSGSFYIPACH